MPRRPNPSQLSVSNLPILPFLAPAIFAPWPNAFRGRNGFATAPLSTSYDKHLDPTTAQYGPGSPRNPRLSPTWRARDLACDKASSLDETMRPISGDLTNTFWYRTENTDPNALGPEHLYRAKTSANQGDRHGAFMSSKPTRNQPRVLGSVRNIDTVGTEAHHRPAFYRIWKRLRSSVSNEQAVDSRPLDHIFSGGTSPKATKLHSQVPASLHRSTEVEVELLSRGDETWPKERADLRTLGRPDMWDLLPWSDPVWAAGFAKLSIKYDTIFRGRDLWKNVFVGVRRYAIGSASLARELHHCKSSSDVMNVWLQQPFQERQTLWPSVMLHVLGHYQVSALKILMGTFVAPFPPSYAVSDSIEYAIDYHFYFRKEPATKKGKKCLASIRQILLRETGVAVLMSQKSIALLLRHLDSHGAKDFYRMLLKTGNPLHEDTLLHFVDVLARAGDTDVAVQVLDRLHAIGADFTQSKVESVCATLLRKNNQDKNTTWSDSKLFAHMLDLGLRPNIILYNILLQNAIDAGDSETGWRIHDMMLQNNVDTDAYTYSILLNDAKYRMDQEAINRILSITSERNLINNQHLITDLLHTRFLMYERDTQTRKFGEKKVAAPFEPMLSIYSRCFDIEPLATIAPEIQAYGALMHQSPSNHIYPPKPTLVVMLIALLRSFDHHQQVAMFYDHFRMLVLEKNPAVLPLLDSTHVYDAIIMALGRSSKTLPMCTQVISDMFNFSSSIDALPSSIETDNVSLLPSTKKSRPAVFVGHCQPTVRTWSILLKCFIDHGQPRAAEKVLSLMRSRGIQPNQITWNSLLVGYARLQDISNTASVIERMEDEGWKIDEVSMKGLERVHNRGALTKALEGLSQRKSLGNNKTAGSLHDVVEMAGPPGLAASAQ